MGRLILVTSPDGVLVGAATTEEEFDAVCSRVIEREMQKEVAVAIEKLRGSAILPFGAEVSSESTASLLKELEDKGLILRDNDLMRKMAFILLKCRMEVVNTSMKGNKP